MRSFFKGFVYAFHGLVIFFRNERNGKVQLAVAVVVVAASFGLHISTTEWMKVLACIAAVLSLEMLNSAIEKLCNLVQPGFHPMVKIIKDISAGAVLWVAMFSTIIGAIIFLPKIWALL